MDTFAGLLFGGIIIGMCIYYGLNNIAWAIRTRHVDIKLPPVEVHHRYEKETP